MRASDGRPGGMEPPSSPAAACSRVACGTGWWTPHHGSDAQRWLATDLNPETMAVARSKAMPAWSSSAPSTPTRWPKMAGETFDAAFAGCWWSTCRWSAWPAGWRRCTPGWSRRARGDPRQQLHADQQHADLAPRRRRQHLPAAPLADAAHEVLKNFRRPKPGSRCQAPRARNRSGSRTSTAGSCSGRRSRLMQTHLA